MSLLTVGFILLAALASLGVFMAKAKTAKSKHGHGSDIPEGVLDVILYREIIRHLVGMEQRIMATLADVNASIATQTDAIKALADAIAAKPPAAATEADLDGVKAGIDANTAAVNAIPR